MVGRGTVVVGDLCLFSEKSAALNSSHLTRICILDTEVYTGRGEESNWRRSPRTRSGANMKRDVLFRNGYR